MYDIGKLKTQFREVIEYTQNIPEPKIDELFDRWEKSKEKFISRFGGLVFEWPEPVEFLLDPKDKEEKANAFIDRVNCVFMNNDLAEFLNLNIETFFDNKVSNEGNKKVPKGMKLIKAFKYFEKNETILREMQDIASQLIQENCIKGTLCFSVHPLDFLTSSENTYNWRSCHALDGEFRAGNLSYMVDKTTFMVYLKGADNVVLPGLPANVPWNSKKWRMLIHTGEDDKVMFAGRQYPFASKTGIDTVLRMYNNMLLAEEPKKTYYGNPIYGEWYNLYVDGVYRNPKDEESFFRLFSRYMVYNQELIDIDDAVRPGQNSLNYNDILHSTCYIYPYYAILGDNELFNPVLHSAKNLRENPIVVGEKVRCLHCGNHYIDNAETMRCNDCEALYGYEENDNYGYCECCGCRICYDDAMWVGDDYVCDRCFENECFICDRCGEAHYNEFKHCVERNEEIEYYCNYCYEEYLDAKERD